MAEEKSYHVLPEAKEGWNIKKSSSSKTLKKFPTQREAVEYAKDIAQKKEATLYIHGKNGLIKDSISYGKKSSPPKNQRPIGEAKGKISIASDFDEEYVSNE